LGASVSSIFINLSKDFLALVAIGMLLAWPIAYFLMSRWLTDFAYRTEIGVLPFLLAGLLALLIAWAAVSYQAIRAALANPVEALRYE
ncbi:MAG: ABC transporter permease, partial [bacterium]